MVGDKGGEVLAALERPVADALRAGAPPPSGKLG